MELMTTSSFDSFLIAEQNKILTQVSELLGLTGRVQIQSRLNGGVRLVRELSQSETNKLYHAAQSGDLDHLGIVGAVHVVDPTEPPPPPGWLEFLAKYKEGDVVRGTVVRKIRGGLLFDCGIHAFLSAAQVEIRRPSSLDAYIGQSIECQIVIIDEPNRNVVVSRRKLLEPNPWDDIETKYAIGSRHFGEVVKITSYGAFVQLEHGIEGLVFIFEMSWTKRINDPHEMVSIGDRVEVQILTLDHEKQRILLGMKQLQPTPTT